MALVAAAPALLAVSSAERFVRENATVIAVAVCLVLAYAVVRLAVAATTRVVLLGILVAAALFVYVQRDELADCAETCTCRIAGEAVDVGTCSDDLIDLGG